MKKLVILALLLSFCVFSTYVAAGTAEPVQPSIEIISIAPTSVPTGLGQDSNQTVTVRFKVKNGYMFGTEGKFGQVNLRIGPLMDDTDGIHIDQPIASWYDYNNGVVNVSTPPSAKDTFEITLPVFTKGSKLGPQGMLIDVILYRDNKFTDPVHFTLPPVKGAITIVAPNSAQKKKVK